LFGKFDGKLKNCLECPGVGDESFVEVVATPAGATVVAVVLIPLGRASFR
jgi:hypothetical protein